MTCMCMCMCWVVVCGSLTGCGWFLLDECNVTHLFPFFVALLIVSLVPSDFDSFPCFFLLQGSLPPRTPEEWQVEFDRYKQFPEWQQRQSMTVDEFKYIYFWEYGHRMMGRALGVAFILPMSFFAAKKMIPKNLYPRLFGLLGLGASQVCWRSVSLLLPSVFVGGIQ